MNAPRNTNASLFVTALCACLGLLTAGTPAHARPSAAEVFRSESASIVCPRIEASVAASFRELKTEDRWHPDRAAAPAAPPAEISSRNAAPLVRNDHVLIVTRLARAALSEEPALELKAD